MPGGFEPVDTVKADPGAAMLPRSADCAAPGGGVAADANRPYPSAERVRV